MDGLNLLNNKFSVDQLPIMIWITGIDTKCEYVNKAWLDFSGNKLEDELGEGWLKRVHPEDYNRRIIAISESSQKGIPFEIDYWLQRHDGKWRLIYEKGAPLFNESQELLGYVGCCTDITEKLQGKSSNDNGANDILTVVLNRQQFEEALQLEMDKGVNPALLILDIDNFKKVNDIFGHLKGDQILKHIAQIIKDKLREGDFLGRYGGEEFIICLSTANLQESFNIAEKIQKAISRNPIIPEEKNLKLTVSIGIGILSNEIMAWELIAKAEKTMSLAKKRGGNLIVSNPAQE